MAQKAQSSTYFGGGMRTFLFVGLALTAGLLELALLITANKVASINHPSVLGYLAPLVFPVPWMVGLVWCGKVRGALRTGDLSERVAGLCYNALLSTLLAAYAVLGYFVATLMGSIVTR